jgi:acyl carrier protein phosphodiesterase
MTAEEQAWLVRTLSDPTVRAMLERLAPRLPELQGVRRLVQALDRARAELEAHRSAGGSHDDA